MPTRYHSATRVLEVDATTAAYDAATQTLNIALVSASFADDVLTAGGTAAVGPRTPDGFMASTALTGAEGAVDLSWNASPAATSYDYQWRTAAIGLTTPAGDWTVVTGITGTSATFTGAADVLYDFQVRARNASGFSGWSVTQSASGRTVDVAGDPPGVPGSFSATASTTTAGAVVLTWTEPTGDPDSYELQWRTSAVGATPAGDWQGPDTGITLLTATKTGLTGGMGYDFQIRARNPFGEGGWSGTQSATPHASTDTPGVPGSFSATASTTAIGAVVLAWTESTGDPDSYEIQWRTSAVVDGDPGPWQGPDTGITLLTATKTGLTGGTGYDFQVRARNTFGVSAWSGSQSATPYASISAPSIPKGLSAEASTVTARAVVLDWNASTTGDPDTYEYRWRTAMVGMTAAGEWQGPDTGIVDTEAIKTGLIGGTQYDFQVAARNVFGRSAFSGSQQATPHVSVNFPSVPQNLTAVESTTTAPRGRSGLGCVDEQSHVLRISLAGGADGGWRSGRMAWPRHRHHRHRGDEDVADGQRALRLPGAIAQFNRREQLVGDGAGATLRKPQPAGSSAELHGRGIDDDCSSCKP